MARKLLSRVPAVASRLLLAFVGLLFLTAAASILLLSQTVIGRQFVEDRVEAALEGTIHGDVQVGPILGGDLITGAILDRFEIADSAGRPFVLLRNVRLRYNPLGFLRSRFRFRYVEIETAEIHLLQDADGTWNFDRLFGGGPDTTQAGSSGGTRLLLSDVSVGSGTLEVRTPWAADLTGAARTREVTAALRGERLWRVLRTGPDRYERVLTLEGLRGRLPLLRLVDPGRPMRFELEEIACTARVVTRPLEIERFDGEAVFGDTIRIGIDRLQTSHTELDGNGWVVPTDPPLFSFDLAADPLGFGDLQWLPVPVPSTGGGPTDLSIATRDASGTIVVSARDGDVTVGDSRMTGGFRLALEATPRFERLDVRFAPLRIRTVDQLLDRPTLRDGYVRGTLEGTGPISLVDVRSELELSDLPDSSSAPPSGLRLDGGLAFVEPRDLGSLRVGLTDFEPGWISLLGFRAAIGGRVDGTMTFDGRVGEQLDFTADIRHVEQAGAPESVVRGDGRVRLGESPWVNVNLDLEPLHLAVLSPWLPGGLRPLGQVRGPVSADGPLSDLHAVADFRTPRGLVHFNGRFDLLAEKKTYDARLTAEDIQLDQWIDGAPATRLAVQGDVSGAGTDPSTLEARFDLVVLRSLVEGAVVDSSLLRFRVANGLATVDTFAIRSEAGQVDGTGAFGLASDRSGSLVLHVRADDLSEWNRWLVKGRNPARPETDLTDLLRAFGQEAGGNEEAAAPASPDTLSGRLEALGVLYGNRAAYSFGGRIMTLNAAYGPIGADSLLLVVGLDDPLHPDSLYARAGAVGFRVSRWSADSVRVEWTRRDTAHSSLAVEAVRDTSFGFGAIADLDWTDAAKEARIRQLDLRGEDWRLALVDTARVRYGEGGLEVRDLRLRGGRGASLSAEGVIPDSGDASFRMQANDVRLESLLGIYRNPLDVSGRASFEVTVRGTASEPRMEVHASVRDPSLGGLAWDSLDAELSYADRRLAVTSSLSSDDREIVKLSGRVLADLSLRRVDHRLLDDPLDLTLELEDAPLRPLELRFASLRDVQGRVDGSVRITGSPDAIELRGATRILDASAAVPALGVRYRDIRGQMVYAGATVRIDTLALRSAAGGTGYVKGRVGLEELTDPSFDLEIGARDLRAMDQRSMKVTLSGRANLNGSYTRPELTGQLRVFEGQVDAERLTRRRSVVDLTNAAYYTLLDTTLVVENRLISRLENPFMRNLRIDVTLAVGPDFWLRSETIDVELNGSLELQMDRAAGDVVATGSLELPRGKVRYVSGSGTDLSSLYSRQLQIDRGQITFVGTPGIDPNLDIDASYRTASQTGPVDITVHVGGTMLSPTMQTSSEPPLPESDRICYLLFSTACFRATSQEGQFAGSLLREGLLGTLGSQVSQVLVSGVGIVDYVDIRSTGERQSSTGPESQTSLLYGTEVEIGSYLTPELFVRVTQPLGGQLPGFSLEWTFAPKWRLELLSENLFDRYSIYGYSYGYTLRTWGVSLFREWNF